MSLHLLIIIKWNKVYKKKWVVFFKDNSRFRSYKKHKGRTVVSSIVLEKGWEIITQADRIWAWN